MNEQQFFERAEKAKDDAELIDELCIAWLKSKAKDFGKEGRIALDVLKIFEVLTE